jgi:ABC-type multidrug transport system ATPase subunit
MGSEIANRRDDLTLVEPARGRGKVVLHVEALRKHYGAIEAVAGVSFELRQGEVFGLLGLNGAGKTTLISMLATLRHPSGGDALLLGHSIRNEWRALRHMIGVAPQENALYPMLTAAENLRFSVASMKSMECSSKIASHNCFTSLGSKTAATISSRTTQAV